MPRLGYKYADFMAGVAYSELGKGRDSSKWDTVEPGTTDLIDEIVQAGYHQAIYHPPIGGKPHIWSWMSPTKTLLARAAVTGTLNAIPTRVGNEYVIEVTTSVFTSDMVGLKLKFDDTGHEFTITTYVSATRVKAVGDAGVEFGEYPAVGILESADFSELGTTVTADAVFTLSMVGATLTFGSNDYVISEYTSSTVVRVLGDASAESGAFTVGSVSGTATDTTLVTKAVLEATESIFTADHEGLTVVFKDPSGDSGDVGWNHPRYTNIEVLSDRKIKVEVPLPSSPDVPLNADTQGESGTFYVVHGGSRLGTIGAPDLDRVSSVNVAGSDAIFSAASVGLTLQFLTTGNRYAIVTYSSSTEVYVLGDPRSHEDESSHDLVMVVGAAAQAAGDTFTLMNAGGDYDLPEDYGGIKGPLTFDQSEGYVPVELIADSQIRDLRQRNTGGGRPQYASIVSKMSDGTGEQRSEIHLFPAADAAYTLTYVCNINPQKLSAEAPYPLGGPEFAELYMSSMLAVAEERVRGTKGLRWQNFIERLTTAIAIDRKNTDPETLGYNGDQSDYKHLPYRRRDRDFGGSRTTVNGVLYP